MLSFVGLCGVVTPNKDYFDTESMQMEIKLDKSISVSFHGASSDTFKNQ